MNNVHVPASKTLNIDVQNTGRTTEEAAAELAREFGVRQRCFADWVGQGKLAKCDAKDRMQRLARACQLLDALTLLGEKRAAEIEAEAELAQAQGNSAGTSDNDGHAS